MPSSVLAARLLDEAGVACLSGTAFGSWGEGYIRLSYANSVENIRLALGSIEEFCQGTVTRAAASQQMSKDERHGSVKTYVDSVIAEVEDKNPGETEFLQAVREVYPCLAPVVERATGVPAGQDPRAHGRARKGDHLQGPLGRRRGRGPHKPRASASR